MDSSINTYNDALDYIASGDYEQAYSLLQRADKNIPGVPLFNRVLGFVEILIGYPHSAVARWNCFSLVELDLSADQKTWAEALLPQYDVIYERYNHALDLIQNGNYDKALIEFKALIVYNKEIALPIPLYRGYFLLLARGGDFNAIIQQIDSSPVYINMSQEIRQLRMRLEEAGHSKTTLVPNRWFSKRYVVALVANVVLIAGLIGTIFVMSKDNSDPNYVLQATTSVSTAETFPLELKPELTQAIQSNKNSEEFTKLDEQVKVMETEREDMLVQLLNAQDKIAEQLNVITLSGSSEDELRLKAANRQYNSGLHLFGQGVYAQAVEAFTESDSIAENAYYSDDNLFYWIEASRKQGQLDEAVILANRFLAETDINYTKSPYMDDIILLKSEILLSRGEVDASLDLLHRIITDYPAEWTADRARQIVELTKVGVHHAGE